jgi:hypothetical protein
LYLHILGSKGERFVAHPQVHSELAMRRPRGPRAIAEETPKAQADQSPKAIDCHIPRRCCPGGDEGLVEFIEGGVERADDECDRKRSLAMLAECAVKQRGEDCVFGEVPAFSNDQLDRPDGRVGKIGREPAQKRADKSRGVVGRKQIGGADEDENHPRKNGEPEFQKSAHQKRNHKAGACANLPP